MRRANQLFLIETLNTKSKSDQKLLNPIFPKFSNEAHNKSSGLIDNYTYNSIPFEYSIDNDNINMLNQSNPVGHSSSAIITTSHKVSKAHDTLLYSITTQLSI